MGFETPGILLGSVIFFGIMFVLLASWIVRWFLGKEEDERRHLQNAGSVILFGILVYFWGGALLYGFERYYEVNFMSNDEYEVSGEVNQGLVNDLLTTGSEACKSINDHRKIEISILKGDKSYCYYLNSEEKFLYPFRMKGGKSEILTKVYPWPHVLELDVNVVDYPK